MRCKLVYKERTAHLFFEGYSLHHVINSVDFLSLSSLPEQNVLGRVLLADGRVWRRHINQLRRRWADVAEPQPPQVAPCLPTLTAVPEAHLAPPVSNNPLPMETLPPENLPEFPEFATVGSPPEAVVVESAERPQAEISPSSPPNPGLRRSGQLQRRPTYLADYECSIRVGRGVESSRVKHAPRRLRHQRARIGGGAQQLFKRDAACFRIGQTV
ncbi:uncharacterized protein LOC132710151 isoform X1 [Pantherophis guttatus]|uniref:Uncharacterized protein LOC132710151 isoform X1 n=1 Tax=Pantherophis guttatus TaxID=94885 RepID=A0ABM3YZT4_PANGU|nr:uncharacterized protein LOC132710151 isoform X1 [Pantherophis guttatus]